MDDFEHFRASEQAKKFVHSNAPFLEHRGKGVVFPFGDGNSTNENGEQDQETQQSTNHNDSVFRRRLLCFSLKFVSRS